LLSMHLLVYALLALKIVVPLPGLAENNPPGEVHEATAEMNPSPISPSPISPSPITPSPINPSPINRAPTAASQKMLPEALAQQKVIDQKFIAAMATLGGAESLRFTTHKMVLDREFAAGAPWVTNVPSGPHMVAKYGGIFAGELLVAYELKKPHDWLPGDKVIRKLWWAPPAVLTIIHIKNGIRSIRTQGPGGCTSVAECEGQ
jgi:hypothetical protein